ncbi:hypothetical protein OCL06_14870 [Alteromonas sp. ASW11-19]|uniref:DUF2244 domain-containing protein n=1 Tax=Alteromonas salexigens TaxID=2982530 RepID=A0ABT2VRD5_9ALTE|nr:hypothetical protein [Alteromonas salexigens]MCU7555871.1 hypothetical protein [Alteromonas salexigens]
MKKPIVVRTFNKAQIQQAEVISGISPNAMRRVFGGWILFAGGVAAIVAVAPELSAQFILMTMLVLVAFTVAMFAQSRIAEGWPSIICDDDHVCVVKDPQAREFICVPGGLVRDVEPTLIKPNKKAVAIKLNTAALTEADVEVLNQAVWPRDDRVLGLAHFKRREQVCERVRACLASTRNNGTNGPMSGSAAHGPM